MKVLNIGLSKNSVCGVHDYAAGFAEAFGYFGDTVETRWCGTGHRSRSAFEWIRTLRFSERAGNVDVIVWHYSVFAYGSKGIPYLVLPVLAKLRRLRSPIVVVLHEYAYPWKKSGWRGLIWAVSQRLFLIPVVWSSRGLIVTVQERSQWLKSRFWLPNRCVLVVPVFSNLPQLSDVSVVTSSSGGARIGMFGYASSEATLTMKALAALRVEVPSAELWLIGTPGENSESGLKWREAAVISGVTDALRFTGTLSSDELLQAIIDCDVSVFHDGLGPSSRKTTLAALLAAGVPVIAVDGPDVWQALIKAEAVALVDPSPDAIASELAKLLQDVNLREALGQRGRQFSEIYQKRENVVREVAEFVTNLI
jgi:glycosyltransferase involved in cell wall biosynthesis